MKIKVIKYDNYKGPVRAHYNDSGADVFSAEDVVIRSHSVESIKLGVGVYLPDGYDIVIHCKSGMARRGIIVCNSPIDAGYTGEIEAIVYNSSDEAFKVEAGSKIGQFVVRPVVYADFVEELGEERGNHAFGSTGNF